MILCPVGLETTQRYQPTVGRSLSLQVPAVGRADEKLTPWSFGCSSIPWRANESELGLLQKDDRFLGYRVSSHDKSLRSRDGRDTDVDEQRRPLLRSVTSSRSTRVDILNGNGWSPYPERYMQIRRKGKAHRVSQGDRWVNRAVLHAHPGVSKKPLKWIPPTRETMSYNLKIWNPHLIMVFEPDFRTFDFFPFIPSSWRPPQRCIPGAGISSPNISGSLPS